VKPARIFLLTEDSRELVPMDEASYGQEIVIQKLLESHPDLLPGDQISPENARRWLLVTGEMAVPDAANGSGRWSLDHLFLDQDGIPTFVECKRAVDTRRRREVVAQMLDYAANGIEYWSTDRLRQAAAETANRQKKTLDDEVRRLLEADSALDLEGYWERVETNLKEGKVRLIFVAEETSKELRRLVEFLNDKLRDIEVLAIEIKQFIGDGGRKVLVPRVVGLTEVARERKAVEQRRRRKTNQTDFLAKCSAEVARIIETILDETLARGHEIYWGEQNFSIRARLSDGKLFTFAYAAPDGDFEFYDKDLPIPRESVAALRKRLMGLGLFTTAGTYTMRTRIDAANFQRVIDAYKFILNEIQQMVRTKAPEVAG
jgi:hypothetical protein